MDLAAVLQSLFEDLRAWQIVLTLGCSILAYYLIFRRRIVSILDPLAYTLFFSSCTVALLALLFVRDLISFEKVIFTATTLVLFYGAFLATTGRRRGRPVRPMAPDTDVPSGALATLFIANTILSVTTYAFFGIPLFLESRLTLWAGGGGFGAIGRLTGGLQFVSLLLAFIALKRHRASTFWAKCSIALFVVNSALSGSKGPLLTAVYAWYLAQVYEHRSWNLRLKLGRLELLAIFVILAFPFAIIIFQNRADGLSAIDVALVFATRIAGEGDGYIYFFTGDLIDSIARFDPLALIRPLLTGLRIASADTAYNPGFEVVRELFGIDEPISGPNSRLPIYLLYFYGYGGIVLAPLLGFALGRMRNAVLSSRRTSAFRFSIVGAIYLLCTKLEADPQITTNGLFDLILASPILALAWMLGRKRRKTPRRRSTSELPSAAPSGTAPGIHGHASTG